MLGSNNRLQQVFLNLFMNARDAMPSGGTVEVRTASYNGSVEIEVTYAALESPARICADFRIFSSPRNLQDAARVWDFPRATESSRNMPARLTGAPHPKANPLRRGTPRARKAVHAPRAPFWSSTTNPKFAKVWNYCSRRRGYGVSSAETGEAGSCAA